MLSACDSLPEDVEREASRVNAGITELEQVLAARKQAFDRIKANSEEWEFFQSYAEREGWTDSLAGVKSELRNLRERYENNVVPLLKKDESKDAGEVRKILESIAGNFKSLNDDLNTVRDRMQLLREGYENAPTWIAEARSFVSQAEASITSVQDARNEAKADFPTRATAIDERFAPLSHLLARGKDALVRAEEEFVKHESGEDADYAIFADAYTTTRQNAAEAATGAEEYLAQLESLYKDYTLILRDMKTEYRVRVARTSWDNYYDFPREYVHQYPDVPISKADYEYLVKLPQGESKGAQGYLARRSTSWGGSANVFIDASVWNRFNINMDTAWVRGDDEAMFWIEDLYPVYFHRYDKVSGSNRIEGGWEEVDESEYGLYADSFGMAIESKPIGAFADEAINEPVPAGMAMVGNDRYGEWRQDTSGNSFWHWYGQYAFFSTLFGSDPYRFRRAEFDDFDRWKRDRDRQTTTGATRPHGWYGTNRTAPSYGSKGGVTRQTAAYKGSAFDRTGGAASVPRSVRSAGANARGRGPGGGGK